MSVKSLLLTCDYCYTEAQVDFKDAPEDDEEFFTVHPLPDEDWYHVEHDGAEKDYCSEECLRNDI